MQVIIHPAVAADFEASLRLAARHGMQVVLEGHRALLEPLSIPNVRAIRPRPVAELLMGPTGGDAA